MTAWNGEKPFPALLTEAVSAAGGAERVAGDDAGRRTVRFGALPMSGTVDGVELGTSSES
jgi:hypothetical protein